ncbi:flagellar hook capping FlgD N-terminal domain-containing protein [Phaeobacter marinintestinus]|uniref:flagellar hook capping FlgD N-terminal domain-containing protein n=1 Tax=Falsiphaeobacter marinintestinus TaxID=1492905 RepID=UPI0011B570FD|nr:flagellar hook capping FlgD N-terminal domain-containing protein [Phaeobacter marinintestinus]
MITDVSSVGTQGAAADAQTQVRATALASDFETFLKMLTAQAKYQDPLEPIDSSEYAAQLAQFSMVEQQVQTNEALAALHADIGLSNMAGLANWVGMEARAAMPAYFDGASISVSANPVSVADKVELVVRNSAGEEIDRKDIPVSAKTVEWAGQAAGGAIHPWGTYTFTVESYAGGSLISSEQAEVYDRITEAQAQGGEVVLIFEGGQAVVSTAVTGLRQPD